MKTQKTATFDTYTPVVKYQSCSNVHARMFEMNWQRLFIIIITGISTPIIWSHPL